MTMQISTILGLATVLMFNTVSVNQYVSLGKSIPRLYQ